MHSQALQYNKYFPQTHRYNLRHHRELNKSNHVDSSILFFIFRACYNLIEMKYFWLALVFISPLNAQFFDDFSDGDFKEHPTWHGTEAHFEINDEKGLHLNAPRESGVSYLSTPTQLLENSSWQMSLKLDFNPSSSNYLDWYLMANDSVLNRSSKAYFVRVGGTTDEVSLYKKINGDEVKIIDGLDKRTDSNPVQLHLKVSQSLNGLWRLWIDVMKGKGWVLEGEVMDQEVRETKYTGIHCVYTSTRSNRFYFDDFILNGSLFIDSIPPKLITSSVANENTLHLQFDTEDLGPPSLNHYTLNPQTVRPKQVLQTGSKITLIFENELPSNTHFQLEIKGLSDSTGNLMADTLIEFYRQSHLPFDLVINEIMMNPVPKVQLPKTEYIELFNRAKYPLTIRGWKVKINHSIREIPEVTIPAQEHLLLTNPEDLHPFNAPFKAALSPWVSLGNTESYIGLMDEEGNIIHEVEYHKSWVQNSNKERGGWALEMMDPEHYCSGKINWGVCKNDIGGTPGFPNSIREDKDESSNLHIQDIVAVEQNEIQIHWSENLYDSTLFTINSTSFYPAIDVRNIRHIQNKTWVQFAEDLKEGESYLFETPALKDCYHHEIQKAHHEFRKGLWPETGAIYLNELLFNPLTGGYDYVELYNTSEEYIDLSKLYLGNYDSLFNTITNTERITTDPVNFPPKTYLALCENKGWMASNYKTDVSVKFLEVHRLPNLPSQKGSLALSNLAFEVLDNYSYHEDQHFSRLESPKGVALERLHPTSTKWFSASSMENYGTPGRKNSQFTYEAPSKAKLEILPEVFTPNLDGREDFTNITLVPKNPVKINIHIYNKKGRVIRELCQSELITRKTQWIWDGLSEEKLELPMGIYMIVVELWSSKGKPEYLKHPVVIHH